MGAALHPHPPGGLPHGRRVRAGHSIARFTTPEEAINLLDNAPAEIRAHTDSGIMAPDTAAQLKEQIDDLLARLRAGAVSCADTPPPGTVTACGL